jgi:hypothetical protein
LDFEKREIKTWRVKVLTEVEVKRFFKTAGKRSSEKRDKAVKSATGRRFDKA